MSFKRLLGLPSHLTFYDESERRADGIWCNKYLLTKGGKGSFTARGERSHRDRSLFPQGRAKAYMRTQAT